MGQYLKVCVRVLVSVRVLGPRAMSWEVLFCERVFTGVLPKSATNISKHC